MSTTDGHLSSPLVEKRSAAWGAVRVDHCRFGEGQLPEHSHPEHMLLLALSRCSGELSAAGGFRTRAQVRGGVCVVPSGQPFTARLGGDTECLAIYLDPALVARAARDAGDAGRRFEVVARSKPRDPVVSRVGLALLAEMREGAARDGVARLYAESLANVLAVHVLRHYTADGAEPRRFAGGLSGPTLRRVLSYIADNHERDLSLEDLAGEAAMSTFHFARQFKRATGTTPHQHLLKFRVERAKELLVESHLPLAEVGLRTGFSHQSHFTRLFRRYTGTTPLGYRSRARA
ncbi:MAG: AraC family transcriptional regulator [Acidobacteria bacterium]|nr:AraC family transcriptional regulator [Acidobacteriota bacterium]